MDSNNPDKLIAAMWDFSRRPWTFRSGGTGSGLYITYDGGENREQITDEDGIPSDTLGRIGLAISESEPNIVYALIESKETNALFKSTDGGHSYAMINKSVGNCPFYYSDIFVDPTNSNTLYNQWSRASKSIDGGVSWNVIAPYSLIHPDHHAWYIDRDDPDYMINGNDGGLAITWDGGRSWHYVENLPLGQFYHIDIDDAEPYNVYGGLQDNGSWFGPAYSWTRAGITNSQWQEIYFGDGFDVLPDPSDNDYAYAMSQGGSLARIHKLTGSNLYIKPEHPDGIELRFNWNAALSKDPHNPNGVYYGSQFVHYSTNNGDKWEILSPNLTTNDPEKQKQEESGGLTIDVTTAENHTSIICIAPSPVNKDVIWMGTDDGNVQLTKDIGQSWSNTSSKMKGLPENAYIHQIQADYDNPDKAWVVANHYRSGDWSLYLFYTEDGGKSWKNIAEESGIPSYCLSFMKDTEVEHLYFLGTETGLYFSMNAGDSWQQWTKDYPSVSTMDIKLQEREADLVLGTFGRSIFIIDDIRPLRALALSRYEAEKDTFKLFEMNDAVKAFSLQSPGVRFKGHTAFLGEDRSSRARISYSTIKADDEDETKVSFVVLDEDEQQVRSFEVKPEHNGLNTVTWSLTRKGSYWPSRKKNTRKDEPGFGSVPPGTYTIIGTYKEHSDTTTVHVRFDPRLEFNEADYQVRMDLQDEFLLWLDTAYQQSQKLI